MNILGEALMDSHRLERSKFIQLNNERSHVTSAEVERTVGGNSPHCLTLFLYRGHKN